MASASPMALLIPLVLGSGKKTHFWKSQVPVVSSRHSASLGDPSVPASAWNRSATSDFRSGMRRYRVVAKATGEEDSDSSSGSILKFLKDTWNETEDRVALVGLGFAGVVGFWTSISLIGAIEKLPVIPSVLEFIGLIYSWYFIYRYLLFKPDREKLVQKVKKSLSDVIGK